MLLSSSRIAKLHHLNDPANLTFNFKHQGQPIERVTCYKLLGVQLDQHLNWENQIKKVCSCVYSRLYVLRYLRRAASFHLRKQLAESLLLSRLHYCISLFWNLPLSQIRKLDRLKRRIASFVTLKFSSTEDVITLGWLPMKKEIEYSITRLAHKSMHEQNFPSYLRGFETQPTASRSTRNRQELKLVTKTSEKLFVGKASRLLNELPLSIREECDHKRFCGLLRRYLLDESLAMYYNSHKIFFFFFFFKTHYIAKFYI